MQTPIEVVAAGATMEGTRLVALMAYACTGWLLLRGPRQISGEGRAGYVAVSAARKCGPCPADVSVDSGT